MTTEEYIDLHNGDEFSCIGKTISLLPGKFKPPHKGHWQMVMNELDKGVDEVHVFISYEPKPIETGDDYMITPEISEKIFNIYASEYGVYDKVVTHVCRVGQSPIISSNGFAKHQCKDCIIRTGQITSNEKDERESGWNHSIKAIQNKNGNAIMPIGIAEKDELISGSEVQGARAIRANADHLTKEMFPNRISNSAFKEICHLINPNVYFESKRFESRFNILYESIMRSLVFEHGIGIKDNQPILLANIEPTLKKFWSEILKPLGISYEALHKSGSTGKKEESGDLDCLLDLNVALPESGFKDKFELADAIGKKCKEYGYTFNNVLNLRFKELQFGIPIVNQDGIASLDIIPTFNVDYAKFRYNSPGAGESKYKGAIRSMLLLSLFKICSHYIDDKFNEKDDNGFTDNKGNVHRRISYPEISFDPDGIVKQRLTFRGTKGNFLSSPRKLEDLKEKIGVSDVQEMIDELFGEDSYVQSDFNSFESIWNNVIFSDKFPYKEAIDDIVVDFVNRFNGDMVWQLEDHKVALPEEAQNYIEENDLENRIHTK